MGTWIFNSRCFHEKFFNNENETKNKIAILVVAFGLIGLDSIIFLNYTEAENQMLTIATRIIGAVFFLRAIGDFNIVGIFKKKSNSKFAKADTKLFIPLCLFIGFSSILISIF